MENLLELIKGFTTDQLRTEINRREVSANTGHCWNCEERIEVHTCRYATQNSPIPGWVVKPPVYIKTNDGLGKITEYWRVDAWHPDLNLHRMGSGTTKEGALDRCIIQCRVG